MATSEILKIDGEGRVISDGGAQASCRDHRRGRVRRPRPQVSDLGARTLPRGARGGHREGARAQEATGLPGCGGGPARSTGMMTSSGSSPAVAGGLARHIPVLGRPAVEFLKSADGGIYIDATFGAGGYTRAILAAANCRVIGIDRDQRAVALGADLVNAAGGRLVLVQDRFSNLEAVARGFGHDAVDGIVFDLGVSSMQLDEAERGFSFRFDGPLDMRMGACAARARPTSWRSPPSAISPPSSRPSARSATRAPSPAPSCARAPKRRSEPRAHLPTSSTRVVHARPGAIHPATRTFQALRMFVNEELDELAGALAGRRANSRARRPAGGRRLPFAGRSHRQDRSSPIAAGAAASPAICRRRRGRGRRSAC